MDLNRRTMIKALGVSGAATAIGGCVGFDDDTADEGETGTDDSGGTTDGTSDDSTDDTAAVDPGQAGLWHAFSDGEAADLEAAIERFETDTGHQIDDEELAELEEQLNTALPVGEGPDTFAWAHDWVGAFEERGWLYDASDDLTVDIEETYTGAGQDAITWQGGVYGLPYAAETVGLLYNREMLDGPPETFDEMVDIMEEYHDPAAGEYGISYPMDPYFISAWVHSLGGYYYDAETDELGLELSETVEGFELVVDEFWRNAPADPTYESQVAVFNDGNAPLAINGPWQVGGFRDAGIDVGVAKLPTVNGNEPSPYTGVQMMYFTHELADDDDSLRAARDFAEWYTTDEEVILGNADNHGFIPVNEDFADDADLSEDVVGFANNVDIGRPMPAHPKMDQVWGPVADAIDRALDADQDPAEALAQAADEIRGAWEDADY